uniref:Uncharacterized protein n=1 Tax=Rhizophora mucronata TaxID=61149 RepID=A0A2P2QPA5_RHIMU
MYLRVMLGIIRISLRITESCDTFYIHHVLYQNYSYKFWWAEPPQ